MRNKRWLRYGLASLTLVGASLGAFLAACGDDDNGANKADSGADTGTPYDSGPGGDSDPNPGLDAGSPAKVILVHAATSLGPATDLSGFAGGVRVCYATATKENPTDDDFATAPFVAQPSDGGGPSYPGLFIGTGGPLPSSGADLETLTIRPYLLNAKTLNDNGVVGADPSTPRCGKLLGDGGLPDGGSLVANVDYWQLGDIPAGTLKKNRTYILAVTGCTSNAVGPTGPVPPGFCGASSDGGVFTPTGEPGVGNLKILVLEVDTTGTLAADEFGAAAIHLSPQHAAAKAASMAPAFKPTLLNAEFVDGGDGADAATDVFPVVPGFGEVAYDPNAKSATTLTKIKGLVTTNGYFALANTSPTAAGVPFGAVKLNNVNATSVTVQRSTTGSTDTTELYVNGKAYTFILVGDPTVPAADGPRTLHYLGFPNEQ